MKINFIFTFIVVVLLSFLAITFVYFKNLELLNLGNPKREIYIGAWSPGNISERRYLVDIRPLLELEKKVNKKFSIAHFYFGWEYLTNEALITDLEAITNSGRKPMISVNPYFFYECVSDSRQPLYKTIAEGGCDDFLHKSGRNLTKLKSPIFFRFAWEMNVYSIEWSTIKTGDNPSDYVRAWQRMHDIFQKENANKIVWVFTPNVNTPDSVPYDELYPGDAYVDWVGLDGYNWGDTQSWSNWESFENVFKKSYEDITKLAPKKPVMISEVNSTHVGGDKAVWYSEMLENQLLNSFPQVQAVVFFNEDRTKTENVNWLIDINSETLKAFKNGIQNPIYR